MLYSDPCELQRVLGSSGIRQGICASNYLTRLLYITLANVCFHNVLNDLLCVC